MRHGGRRSLAAGFAGASALSLAVSGVLHAQTSITPYVEAAFGYIDNVNLERNGDPDELDSFAFEISPGITIDYASPRLRGNLDYRFQYLNYYSDIDENRSYHNLNSSGTLIAVPEWFFVSAFARYSQVLEDASGRSNYNNLFLTGNQRDVFTAGITPTLRHDFGRVTGELSYTVGLVDYRGGDDGRPGDEDDPITSFNARDSDYYRLNASLAASDQDQRFVWALRYSSACTEYQADGLGFLGLPERTVSCSDYDANRSYVPTPENPFNYILPFQYDRASLDMSLAVARTIRVVGEVGQESDVVGNTLNADPTDDFEVSIRDGGLDRSFWNAGLRWEPDSRSMIEGRVGRRFDDESYFLEARRQASQLEFKASYREEPSTGVEQQINGNRPGDLGDDQRPDPFLLKEARIGLTLDGRRTVVGLEFYDVNRDYLGRPQSDNRPQGEDRTGILLNVDRDLTGTMRLEANLSTEQINRQRESDRGDDDYRLNRFSVDLIREIGSRSELSAVAGFNAKTGDGRRNYSGSWIGVRYRYEF